MPTLAPKLPWTHPFAGGYPRVAGQPLPTDPDAINYLNRVAAADGAAVEVGVAMAVDAFVKGCKADGTWSALKASCIMCGARTISGALVPLVGAAPTGYGDWASGDYDRSSGLKGNGSTKYLDSNRSNDADGQDDNHNAAYITTVADGLHIMGSRNSTTGRNFMDLSGAGNALRVASRANSVLTGPTTSSSGKLVAHSRSLSTEMSYRLNEVTYTGSLASQAPDAETVLIYARRNVSTGDAEQISGNTLAFYSIGASLDLALLDARVSTLVAAIAAAL